MSKDLTERAYSFFCEKAIPVKDKPGTFNVNQTDYYKHMKEQGVPADVLKQLAEVETAVVSGGIRFMSDQATALMAEAKKKGEDPKDVTVRVRVAAGNGTRIKLEGRAHRSYPDMSNPGRSIDKFGVIAYKCVRTSAINQEEVAAFSAAVQAQL